MENNFKIILGIDAGTNSIGWSLVRRDFERKHGTILGMGVRIIPMSQDILNKFGEGNSVSQTAERTRKRSIRRLRERHLLRRERLHRVLNILKFLPAHYSEEIDFTSRPGQFRHETEPKVAYKKVWHETKNKYEHEFIFKDSFTEMLNDFRQSHPDLLEDKNGNPKQVPYDWTIYYLRKKALTQKIQKEELAWILLNFNQKRGYYQVRGEDEEETPNKLVEYHSLKVVNVTADPPQKGSLDTWYSLELENGWVYRCPSKTPQFDWKGKVRDFIVTTELNEDGTIKKDKEGKERRSFRAPGDDDWTLIKKKTEQEISRSQKTVGEFIYDTLLATPDQKIRGKLIRTVERRFYKDELRLILQKQTEFHPELKDEKLFVACINELYRNNENHSRQLKAKNFLYLFIEDIIFYQRPLRSQKSTINNCSLEFRYYLDDSGSQRTKYLKAIPKSNPYYQEFRIWQWMSNLAIYRRDDDLNVTNEFLSNTEDRERLFEFLNNRKGIKQKTLIKFLLDKKGLKGKELNSEVEKYRWNYVEDKEYPCNEIRSEIINRLAKVKGIPADFVTREIEQKLWHIIYSVTDKTDFEKALKKFAIKNNLDVLSFVEAFKRCPPFESEYGSYSEKAIKKLLALMRLGKYWSYKNIDDKTKGRIEKIINGEFDENIKDRVREKTLHLTDTTSFQGLPIWLAQYVVYDRHSEASTAQKWNSVEDLEEYLRNFKQHSLRNPIVEQVVTEILRVVRDIWLKYGNGAKGFFDEIHIELGREMKNPAEERDRITRQITENENTNFRIKALLAEMFNDGDVENVRPHSPMQQEILKVYEETVLNSGIEIEADILRISKSRQPSSSDLKKYRLWLEQKYRSPYTGEIIPLSKLFTPEYEIEHIIPQSRYFDDSLSNKVICESAVNKLKDNYVGLEFIKNYHGQIVECGKGKKVKIFEVKDYEEFVRKHYAKNRVKRAKLLMDDIPEEMIERQLNDTRYISKFVCSLLSSIVRADENDDGVNSKNLVPCNGKVTNELRQDWGLNDVWNDLILPRFEKLNQLTGTNLYTAWSENHQKFIPTVPLENSKGFSKKRIDHRHHALDALVIACATRDHINLLNNQFAKSSIRHDLNRKLRRFEKKAYVHPQTGDQVEREVPTEFLKPWNNFTADAKNAIERVIVSFKQNLRIINKATNLYQKWVEKEGRKYKQLHPQSGINWAIRKPMHKATIYGLVSLRKTKKVSFAAALDNIDNIVDKSLKREILSLLQKGFDKKKIKKHFNEQGLNRNGNGDSRVDIYYWDENCVATRNSIIEKFNTENFDESDLDKITDTGIRKILKRHLRNYMGRVDENGNAIPPQLLAFSPEGVEDMNNNIKTLNDGKPHQPIFRVRTFEAKGNKFAIGQTGNKIHKYAEAEKGTNLFYAIYEDASGNRNFETIPLNVVIERQKQGLSSVPDYNGKGDKLKFSLSPYDLVYVPTKEERQNIGNIDFSNLAPAQIKRIFVVNDFSETCYFTPNSFAKAIARKEVDLRYDPTQKKLVGSFDDKTASLDGEQIKEICLKINVDRLGNIIPSGRL